MIEEKLSSAADDLTNQLSKAPVPSLSSPKKQTLAPRLIWAACSLALIAATIVGLFLTTNAGSDKTASSMVQTAASTDPLETQGVTGNEKVTKSDFVRPTNNQFVSDPDFGGAIRAITSAKEGQALIPIPGRSSFNSDGRYLVLYQTGSEEKGHVLFDGKTFERLGFLDISPLDVEQVYWNPKQTNELFYVSGLELTSYDVSTKRKEIVHNYEGCESVSGVGFRQLSADGSLFGQLCVNSSGNEIVLLNLVTGTEYRAPTNDDLAPQPSLSGSFVIASRGSGVVEVFDNELKPTGVSFSSKESEFAMVLDNRNRDLYATVVFDGDDNQVGSLVLFDLETGQPEVIVGPETQYPYPPGGVQYTVSLDGELLVFSSASVTAGEQEPLSGEVVVADFGSDSTNISRLVRHRSTGDSTSIDEYWSSAFVAAHPDKTKVLFSSDWGQTKIDTFEVNLFGEGQ